MSTKRPRSNWHVCRPTRSPDSRIDSRTPTPVSDTSAPKNAVHHHASQPRETRKGTSSFPSANCKTATRSIDWARFSRSATEGRATLQDSSLPQRRKCVKFVKSHQSTDAKTCIHCRTKHCTHGNTSPVKSNFSVLLSNTRRREQRLPGTMSTEKMHQIPSANNASAKERKFFEEHP